VFIQFVACVNEGETSASRSYSYVPNAGPTWFLVWLLIFNVVYASLPDNFPPRNLTSPGVLKMSMWAVTLVVIQLVLMFLMETFVFMPITIGSLPFNILFFACGVLAKRGGWLDKGLDVPSTTTRYFPVAFSLCYIGAFFAFMVYTFHIGGGSVMPTDYYRRRQPRARYDAGAGALCCSKRSVWQFFFSDRLPHIPELL